MTRRRAIIVHDLGHRAYVNTWQAMQDFTARRDANTPDELWLVEHPPVYTLGRNAKHQPLRANGIPVVPTDRGGDITYHGPGQAVVYALIDLARRGMGVKALVQALEQAVIDLLAAAGVRGERRPGAPGVYVDGRKIAALGLRVKQGRSYHGLALNADMDLSPFADIAPCGYAGLEVTQLCDLGLAYDVARAGAALCGHLQRVLATMPPTERPETGTEPDHEPQR